MLVTTLQALADGTTLRLCRCFEPAKLQQGLPSLKRRRLSRTMSPQQSEYEIARRLVPGVVVTEAIPHS